MRNSTVRFVKQFKQQQYYPKYHNGLNSLKTCANYKYIPMHNRILQYKLSTIHSRYYSSNRTVTKVGDFPPKQSKSDANSDKESGDPIEDPIDPQDPQRKQRITNF
eukprot:119655_1